MSYDYDAVIEAARDENNLLPTLGAQKVLVSTLRAIDAVDEAWYGRGAPPEAVYVAAVRDQMIADYNAILRVALEGNTTVGTDQEATK